MSSVPMPRDLSEEAVAEWLDDLLQGNRQSDLHHAARAVRAMLREKVREAVREGYSLGMQNAVEDESGTVSRVLGEEAPRG